MPVKNQVWFYDGDGDGYHSDKKTSTEPPDKSDFWFTTSEGPDCDDNPLTGADKNVDCTQEEESPCDRSNRLFRNNPNIINELNRLKRVTNNNFESGSVNIGSDNEFPVSGQPNTINSALGKIPLFDIIFDPLNNNGRPISGFAHTHSENVDPIFSISDVAVLGVLAANNLISNGKDFVFTVTTGLGTTYSLLIEDFGTLVAFSDSLNSNAEVQDKSDTFVERRNRIHRMFFRDGLSIKESFIKANEIVFLDFIRSAGLTLTKEKDNGKWEILTKPNPNTNRVRRRNCR